MASLEDKIKAYVSSKLNQFKVKQNASATGGFLNVAKQRLSDNLKELDYQASKLPNLGIPVNIGKSIGKFALENTRTSTPQYAKNVFNLSKDIGPKSAAIGSAIAGGATRAGLKTLGVLSGLEAGIEGIKAGDLKVGVKKTLQDLPQNLVKAGLYSGTGALTDRLLKAKGITGFIPRNTTAGLFNVGEDILTSKAGLDPEITKEQLLVSFLAPGALEGGAKFLSKVFPGAKVETVGKKARVKASLDDFAEVGPNKQVTIRKLAETVQGKRSQEIPDPVITKFLKKNPTLREQLRRINLDQRGSAEVGTLLGRPQEDPLIQEAKKYKSAEEFVKAQESNYLYHGTSEGTKIDQFKLDKANWGVGSNAFAQGNKGTYLTDDIGSAKYFSRKANEFKTLMQEAPDGDIQAKNDKAWEYLFGKNATKGENIVDVFLENGARIKELNSYPSKLEIDEIIKTGKYDAVRFPEVGMKSVQDLPEDLWKQVKDSKTTFVFNIDKLKTKSQLTDIWNKVNRTSERGEAQIGTLLGKQQEAEDAIRKTPNFQVSPKQKVNIIDYFRTPDRVLKKMGLADEATALRTARSKYLKELPEELNKVTNWYNQVPDEQSAVAIFKHLDGQPVGLNPTQIKVANEIKEYLGTWADKLDLPKDKRITNYITHIFDDQLIQKEFDDDLAKLIQDKVAGSVYDPFTQQRLGALGYKENVWDALDAYIKRGVRKSNMDPALEMVKNKSDKLELSQYNYVKGYIDRINMRPTEVDNLLDNAIKSVFGYKFTARPTAYLTRAGRGQVYRGTLGLNIGSAFRNLTQGVNTYSKLGEKYTLKGYYDLVKNGTEELRANGVLSDDIYQDRSINATKKFLEKLDKGLFYFFELAEKINRGSAYYGAKAKALSEGLDERGALEYAKNIVRDTQFTFGSVDTPVALQSDLAKLLTQFQSYNLKQIEFISEMVKTKSFGQLFRFGVGNIIVLSTIGKLLGMEPKDLIPSLRFGTLPPTLNLPVELAGAAFGEKDQYGNPMDTPDRLDKAGKAIVPFIPGGVQIRKSIIGVGDVMRGYSKTGGGNVKFPVKQDIPTALRATTFGTNTLPEAQRYFDDRLSPLSAKQSEAFKQDSSTYEEVINRREENKIKNEVKEQLKESSEKTAEVGGSVFIKQDNGDIREVSIEFDVPTPELTGSDTLDREIIGDYRSKLSKRINDLVLLVQNGKITVEEATAEIDNIQDVQKKLKEATKVVKPKKPGKVTARKISTPKIKKVKFAKMKPLKIKRKAIKRPTIKMPNVSQKMLTELSNPRI